MFPRFQSTILLVSLALIIELLGACGTPPAPTPLTTQAGKISVERSPINVGDEVNLGIAASGDALQFKWTTTAGTFLSSVTAPSVRYKAPDSPGSVIVTVDVTGKGGTVIQNTTLQIVQPITETPIITPTRIISPAPAGGSETLTPLVTVTATPPPFIPFQNFEEDNGTQSGYFKDVFFMPCSFSTPPDKIHEGNRALRCQVQGTQRGTSQDQHGGTVGINGGSPMSFDFSHATTISVWVYDTQGDNNLELKLRDSHNEISNGKYSALNAARNTWSEITWKVSDFQGVDMTEIVAIELYEWNDGVYYFDLVSYK